MIRTLKVSFARVCCVVGLLLYTQLVLSDIPSTISYQGLLTDNAGTPLDGTHELGFALYPQADSPSASWTQVSDVEIIDGVFNVQLGGALSPFPDDVFASALWLGVTVDAGPELDPRQALSSVAYAMKAADSERFGSFLPDELDSALLNKSDVNHEHDTQYYPKAEVDTLIQQLLNTNAALEARLVVLEGQESQDFAAQILSLQTQVTALENANNAATALMQYVTVDGTDVFFEGMNLHLNNGSGNQEAVNGLGNLTIGYNPPGSGTPSRSGSHNLVLGKEHGYTSTGSIISGARNIVAAENASAISAYNAVITGSYGLSLAGSGSEITGAGGVTIAGKNAKAYGTDSLSAGGDNGWASGKYSVRLGGVNNIAFGYASAAVGGSSNNASAPYSFIGGGFTNAITSSAPDNPNNTEGRNSVILGGQNNSLNSNYALIAGGDGNNINYGASTTRGISTTIIGGKGNTASGNFSLIAGGEFNTVESDPNSAIIGRNSNIFGGTNNNARGQDAAIISGDNNSTTVQNALTLGGSDQQSSAASGEILGRVESLEETFAGVSRSSTELIFSGLNIQLVNGLDQSDLMNGLGNLTIGYNEMRVSGNPPVNDRSGSHNLVIGRQNNYSSWGGVIHGYKNNSMGPLNALMGTQLANTSAEGASVFGGTAAQASGVFSSVYGGRRAHSSGEFSTIMGGNQNIASGFLSSVIGGELNTASGDFSLVAGGQQNNVSGSHALVTGGLYNFAGRNNSSIHGGRHAQTSN